VRRVLEWTVGHLKQNGSESPRLEAELLLSHASGWPRIQLYARYDDVLSEDVRARMRELVKRRVAKEPVAYLVGYREFFSLRFEVGPGVFIPRPETETLVVESLESLKGQGRPDPRVLDLCSGSGCVGIAIAANSRSARISAVERSEVALGFARRNAERNGVADRITYVEGDLFLPLAAGSRFDVIACNPPYVAAGEIPGLQADVRSFEPTAALDGGPDGLDVVRRIAAEAPTYLAPGGWLLFEISPEQAVETQRILERAGFVSAAIIKDLAGTARVVKARHE
jgi:release factor glutamine methyltransferase